MTAADQIQMFEPQGAKLAELFDHYELLGRRYIRQAQKLVLRGSGESTENFIFLSCEAQRMAMQCELALQFESLAGLS